MATEVDQKLIDYISKFYFDTGFYPNYEEILEGMKWNSKSTVALHMQRLEREGVIVRKEYGSSQYKLNNIDVVEMAKELAELKRQLPPCKAGDTIYVVPSKVNYDLNILHKYYDNNRVYEQEVSEIRLYSNGYLIVTCEGMCSVVDVSYKETWFLTKEAAEAKLKEMEGK